MTPPLPDLEPSQETPPSPTASASGSSSSSWSPMAHLRALRRPTPAQAALLAGGLAVALVVGLPMATPAQSQREVPASATSAGASSQGALRTGDYRLRLTLDSRAAPPARNAALRRRSGDDALASLEPAADGDDAARGVVRAVREATLSSRVAARIVEMPLADGASFKAGDLLVAFDCDRQLAEVRAANAAVEVQKKTVNTNEELDKFESIGKNDLSISKSQLDKTSAEADALKAQMKDCRMVAPFSGRVIERAAHNHEAVTANQPLLRVVDTSALEMELIVPSRWLQWLSEGSEFAFRIDETGQSVPAVVARLTPTVDPVSKTTKVIGTFRSGHNVNRVLPGMSGSASFPRARG